MPDLSLIKTAIEGGVTVVLCLVLIYLIRYHIPTQQSQFLAGMAEQRQDFQGQIERLGKESREQNERQHKEALEALDKQRADYLEAERTQRADYLKSTEASMTQYWNQFDQHRGACERELAAYREMHVRTTTELANSIRGIADLLLYGESGEPGNRRQARSVAKQREAGQDR